MVPKPLIGPPKPQKDLSKQFFLTSKRQVLCISTSKLVLCMLYPVLTHLFWCLTIFSSQKKMQECLVEGVTSFKIKYQLCVIKFKLKSLPFPFPLPYTKVTSYKEHTPVEQKRHEKHKKDHWRLLLAKKLWQKMFPAFNYFCLIKIDTLEKMSKLFCQLIWSCE